MNTEARANDRTSRPPPSVLCVTRSYPPARGGMEQLSYQFTTSLATRTRTHIIAHRHGGKAALPIFFGMAALRALYRAPACDVVHLGDPVLAGLAPLLRRIHRPTAMTIHGLDILYPSSAYQRYLAACLSSVDLFLPISTFVANLLRERFGDKRSIVVPPGIHDIFYRASVARSALAPIIGQNPGQRPLLLTVGRLIRRKGVAWFTEHVLPRLPKDTLYLVAGDGPERARIEETAQRAGVGGQIILLGSVSDETLRTLYNTVDLFVLPNVPVANDVEGFGIVALEAASCGVPVVASALEGIIDAVHDRQNGRLVTAENADAFTATIMQTLSDTHAHAELRARARPFTLERFSWTVITQRYLDAFQRLR